MSTPVETAFTVNTFQSPECDSRQVVQMQAGDSDKVVSS